MRNYLNFYLDNYFSGFKNRICNRNFILTLTAVLTATIGMDFTVGKSLSNIHEYVPILKGQSALSV